MDTGGAPDPPVSTEPGISILPETVLGSIFEELNARDLCRASLTCAAWRDWARGSYSNTLWRNHYEAKWELVRF